MLDRLRYMGAPEVDRAVTYCRGWADADALAGRRAGVVAWAFLDILLTTGLRANEICAIDVGHHLPSLPGLVVTRSKRKPPLTETLAITRALSAHLKQFVAWKNASEPGRVGPDHPLLVSIRGRYTVAGLQKLFKTIAKRAGLRPDLSIHCGRHTVGMALLAATGNLRAVQKQLGHCSIETTARYYGHISFESMQSNVEKMYARQDV